MLELPGIYFRILIVINVGKIVTILCFLILILFNNNFIQIAEIYVSITIPNINIWSVIYIKNQSFVLYYLMGGFISQFLYI